MKAVAIVKEKINHKKGKWVVSCVFYMHYLSDLDQIGVVCLDHMDVAILSHGHSATNRQQELCHLQQAFIYPLKYMRSLCIVFLEPPGGDGTVMLGPVITAHSGQIK